jgi:hypothetical protein
VQLVARSAGRQLRHTFDENSRAASRRACVDPVRAGNTVLFARINLT